MTPAASGRSVLTRLRPSLVKGLQVGLLVGASAIATSSAPAQAATVTKVFSGFNQAFAPAKWTLDASQGGSASFDAGQTTLTLVRPQTVGTTPTAITVIDDTVLNAFKPNNSGNFLNGFFTYNFAWSSASGANASVRYNFAATENGVLQPKMSPTTALVSSSGSRTSGVLDGSDTFGFVHTKINPNAGTLGTSATGIISNFQFTATYALVPGPLPLAGAAAAFAWSRRLRRRVKSAQFSI